MQDALTPVAAVSSLPMNHGVYPCQFVTVGPIWDRNNMSGGFRVDKISGEHRFYLLSMI